MDAMTNLERLRNAFVEELGVDSSQVNDDLAYGNHGWDSLAHMALVAAIERTFDIMLDTSDVIGMNSFSRATQLVASYGVSIDSQG